MTAMQEILIARFKAANAEANSIEPYDFSQADRLAVLDGRMKGLARQIQVTGLQMNSVGEWVTPSALTFDYAP